ncbi:MAG TPA: chemotaxis protein CheA, partial [Roseibacterium sp.]|nr:chemotaxis protein CheA [Roseibacterium sp.]
DEMKQLAREIQDSVMAIRAQPVKSLFQRMSRIVREASAATGKKVHLEISGEMTEVDKMVIEKLADPLTHMIRNAVDHGLESTDKRGEVGKSEVGTVWLSAAHRSGRIVIEVTDDGAGINRDRVRQIAEEKGLVKPEDQLSIEEIDMLLFRPGFSTVEKVSNLSGRGVGMDVVNSAIRALSGRIAIRSTPGAGSTFSISLPLTLAVLDGMVVEVAGQMLVIPITAIIEMLRPEPGNVHALSLDSDVIFARDTYVPVLDVGYILGYRDKVRNPGNQVFVLVETDSGAHCAILVDTIHDQRQVVIKGLETNYGKVPGIAAATVLGDGKTALILDPNDDLFVGGAVGAGRAGSLGAPLGAGSASAPLGATG